MIAKIIVAFCLVFVSRKALEATNYQNDNLGETRIVGGREATPHAYPFVANIYVEFGPDEGFGCGGTLLNDEWILTAAHCVYHRKNEEYYSEVTVTLGEHDENKDEGTEKVFTTTEVIIHDNYIKNGLNDLALIKLPSPVSETKAISPTCLTSPDKDYVGKTAKAVGWGRISSQEEGASPILKEANIPIVSDELCENVKSFNDKYMLCSGFEKETGKDTVYSGDSGGPLFIEGKGGKKTVIGVSSFVTVDPDQHIITHAVFVELAAHIKWIEKHIDPSTMCTV